MAKIILLTNNDDDVYCFRKELIEAICSEGHSVIVSCPDGPKFEMMKGIPFLHDKLEIDRRGTNPFSDIKLYFHYKTLFKRVKPDVILAYTAKPNVYGTFAAHQLHIPVINNVTGFGSVLSMGGIKKIITVFLFRKAYSLSSCIMFQNKTNMNIAKEKGMVKGLCELIPGSGVDTDRYPLQNYPEGGNGIEGAPVVFNYIGRVLKDKNIDDYIQAAISIKKEFPKTEFNILGFIEPSEKKHYAPLLDKLEREGIIQYRGSQIDVRPYIARAHAIIHPSTYGEGMSNVLLENASSGRFIITTDNPGCMETVRNNETGFIYEGGNVKVLIEKIHEFLSMENDQRKSMGIAGREYVKRRFSRKIVIDTYLSKIQELIN